MTTLASDNFTGLGVDIFNRAPVVSTISALWKRRSGTAFGGDGSDRASPGQDGSAATLDTGASNLDITVEVTFIGSVGRFTVGAREQSAFGPTSERGYAVWNTDASNIRLSWFDNAGVRTDYSAVTAGLTFTTSTVYTVRLVVDGTSVKFYVNGTERISQTDSNVTTRPHVMIGGLAIGGTYGDTRYDNLLVTDIAGDTTAPTLTSVSGTDTGSTSATVSVSSTEAGPGWAVLTPTSTQPSQAQVEAGQDHTGSTTGVFLDTATLAIGANPGAFVFTGLTPGATYWPHVVSKDTATPTANVSLVESGASFTMPSPDLIDPVFAGGTTLNAGTKTNSSIALSTSAVATDNIAVTGYEWSSDNGATYPFTSLTNSFTFTALTALTSYNFRVRAYDAAGNRSTHLALTTSTYRAGDTGQNIVDNTGAVGGNPAGLLYDRVEAGEEADWFWVYEVTPPATGVLTLYPNGTYTFTGPDATEATVQFGKNDNAVGSPVPVYLYTQTLPEGDVDGPVLSLPNLAATGQTTLTGTVTTNETGPGSAVLYPAALGEPSAAQIKAGLDINGNPAVSAVLAQAMTVGANDFLFTGATATTGYKSSFVQDDATPNESNVVTSAAESTLNPPVGPSGGGRYFLLRRRRR